ncbi:hypothetical protein J3D45_000454 [Microbacterium foliorum]|uniref:hypothetical protein n=1 Tax=Microbacterium foliorum TaxID=104336 RepID=UPI00209FADBB|nr:hypothetical protein [Microbacterium foliorum]MCP1427956.1 hypothetical protein [Microbacterium foliorum]
MNSQDAVPYGSQLLVRAMTLLMSGPLIPSCRAQVALRVGADAPVDRFLIDASPRDLVYTVYRADGELVDDYDGYTHTRRGETPVQDIPRNSFNVEHFAARLAFPLSLPVWGRSFDNYRFTGEALVEGEHIQLALVHTKDDRLKGSLLVSDDLRMAVKLDTPTLLIEYTEIAAARPAQPAGPLLGRQGSSR